MKNLSAFIIKFSELSEELDNQLDRELTIALNANFTYDEQDDIMGPQSRHSPVSRSHRRSG